ncbi:MAG TPA: Rrf2 family transcriptional regulator [Armatimonadota bacterium]|jgi:Rrf2 family protein
MFSLTKKTDYALIALCGLAQEPDQRALNTKVLAERYSIPPELLAKILQQLARKALVTSTSGPTGGYRLARRAADISVADVMNAVDGRPALVQCFKAGKDECTQFHTCTIRHPMALVQRRMAEVLTETTLLDLVLSTTETHQLGPIGSYRASVEHGS